MHRTQTICLVILATIAVGFSLAYLKTVLLPFVIAAFIVIGCRPVLEFIERKLRLHRFFAFVVTFAIGGCLLAAFAILTWVSIVDLSTNSAAYEHRLNKIATWLVDHLPDPKSADAPPDRRGEAAMDHGRATAAVDAWDKAVTPDAMDLPVNRDTPSDRHGSVSDSGADTGMVAAESLSRDELSSEARSHEELPVTVTVARDPSAALQRLIADSSKYVQRYMIEIASGLPNLISYAALVLIFVFFLLLETSTSPAADMNRGRDQRLGLRGEIEEQVRKYLLMKTVLSLLTGLAFGFVLWLFGVPLAVVFGFMAFLLNYIPNIGPLLSCALPVPFLVLSADISPTSAIVCFILIASIQFVSGNVVEQRLMGKSFDVSPVVLLLGLIFFGLIWGIVGMFLATPIVSILKIVLQQSKAGKPIAELMAGRLDLS
ncbi:AI-2 transport protein TqsA [Novipirellula galeiformis]|uniref:AI-2 transport protein TqsA n=1 Tax=Novipirellula galeiformis TaxID=2528004 RepID=A0A5C6CA35_9BACT|nr:AI-2E family transporter [Novipirellula galeiformis]TWU21002.1 AI-2 transport protein TqsA [Novipirellula galeiformis]